MLFSIFSYPVFSQSVPLVHYGLNEGLASNTVYTVLSDSKGYLWFATDSGVSRFDGRAFKNFSVSDGLADNDVLNLFEDSSGRIWFYCYNGRLCFFQNGKIYNPENHSILQKLTPRNDRELRILKDERGQTWTINEVGIYNWDDGIDSIYPLPKFSSFPIGIAQIYQIRADRSLYSYTASGTVRITRDTFVPHYSFNKAVKHRLGRLDKWDFLLLDEDFRVILQREDTSIALFHLPVTDMPDKIRYVGFSTGPDEILCHGPGIPAFLIRLDETSFKIDTFDVFQSINRACRDFENNLWITTSGQGVFKMPTGTIENIRPSIQTRPIYDILAASNKMFFASDSGKVFVRKGGMWTTKQLLGRGQNNGRVLDFEWNGIHMAAVGDWGFHLIDGTSEIPAVRLAAYKKAVWNTDHWVVSSSTGLDLVHPNLSWEKTDIKKRIYALHRDPADRIWVGSISGLNVLTEQYDLKDTLYLDARLASGAKDIKTNSKNNMFVATNGFGVGVISGNEIEFIDEEQGLSSNSVRSIYVENDSTIWVATLVGLNRISFNSIPNDFEIEHFYDTDGLNSNITNAVYVDEQWVWVGTDQGLCRFPKSLRIKNHPPQIMIEQFIVNDTPQPLTASDIFRHYENTVQFHFNGISYNSGSALSYTYRMIGISDKWIDTHNDNVRFDQLSWGKYRFEVKAISRNRVESQSAAFLELEISKRWDQTLAFKAGLGLLIIAIVFGIIIGIRYRARATMRINARMAQLELDVIRAQMNPHFVFNAMNAIQHFMIGNDIESANNYLAKFAHLVRLILDSSKSKEVLLEDEFDLISRYVELEHLRFEDKFSYKIESPDPDKMSEIFLPGMIVQPFVENAINHGLVHLKKKGQLFIKFDLTDQRLQIDIIDNGIGRKASKKRYESDRPHHKSQGIELIKERIDRWNKSSSSQIQVEVNDLIERLPESGTHVTITLTLIHKNHQYDYSVYSGR